MDEVLRTPAGALLESELGRETALRIVREATDEIRERGNGRLDRDALLRFIETELLRKHAALSNGRLQRVINATGVLIHTNLGRSPLSENAAQAITVASGYCNVEFDLESGERGRRGASAERLLAQICGAEDGLIVNNCAAAALLVLTAIAQGGEVIVSRGELVEIGGDFRIPDVLEQSGCRLREVGTTNRTKLSDYERAVNAETKVILRVHPSNYRISGFTETPAIGDLADLAQRNGLVLFEDAGSGALIDLSPYGLGEEPVIQRSIDAGADIVAFSGDKLVGGPQAGLIVGRGALIEKVRKHPLYRAVRTDKIVYSGIAATLTSFARGSALEEIPTMGMLSLTYEQLDQRAKALIERIQMLKLKRVSAETMPGQSAIGGGAGTGVKLETTLIAVRHSALSSDDLADALRRAKPPVVARINGGLVVLDLRTVNESDDEFILTTLKNLSAN